jgi:hypothetical protein
VRQCGGNQLTSPDQINAESIRLRETSYETP